MDANYHLHQNLEQRKISLLALWRVLGIDKCAALTRATAKHTPRNGNKNNAENQTERRAARSRPR